MHKRKTLLSAILLLLVTFASMSPSLLAGFTNWDDQIMVTQNAKIMSLSWSSIKVMFTAFHERLYHPFVLISYALEYHFAGLNPHVFHATSLILHLFNTLFVFWFIYVLCGKNAIALIAALLFGIHPMHVESVLWISERKDVMYSFFFLSSLISYLYYLKTQKGGYHLLSLVLFLFSLLSKSMAMTLPLVLILIDHVMQRKMDRNVILDKLTFFALAIPFGLFTVLGHYEPGKHGREFSFSLISNTISVFQNLTFYLIKLMLPIKLSCLYPAIDKIQNIPQIIFALSPLIVLALVALMFYTGKFTRKVIFGGAFFLITIAPVTQILPVGLAVPADRYTYIPYIGFFYLIGEGFEWLYSRYDRRLLVTLISLMMAALSLLTFQRSLVWHDSISLWNDCTKNYRNVPIAYYNLAEIYFLQKWDLDRAIPLFMKAIETDPKYAEAYVNRGLIYYYKRDYKKAVWDYDQAEKFRPDIAEIYINRGNAYNALGRKDDAILEYNRALHINPGQAETWFNLANMYLEQKKFDKAVADYTRAIELKPLYATAYYNRAIIYARRGEYKLALNDALKARSLGMDIDDKSIRQLEKAAKR